MKTIQAQFHIWATVPVAILLTIAFTSRGQPEDMANSVSPIQFENVPITTAIANLARLARINYLLDPKFPNSIIKADGSVVSEPTITANWTDLTAKQALIKVLKEHGLFLVEDPVTSVAEITATNRIANLVDASLLGNNTNAVTPSVPQRFPIQLEDVPLTTALESLARLTGINYVLDPELGYGRPDKNGQIKTEPLLNVHWFGISPKQGFIAICESYDLSIVKDTATDVIHIRPKN
jgi:hypothetical protein